jgi:hypothetical protein
LHLSFLARAIVVYLISVVLLPVSVFAQGADTLAAPVKKHKRNLVMRLVRECSGGFFSKTCFDHFMFQKGQTMQLDSTTFSDIMTNAVVLTDTKHEVLLDGGIKGWAVKVSLYKSNAYAKALGQAFVFYNEQGLAVGFFDRYDFNPKPFGKRLFKYEIMTRGANIYGQLAGGRGFEIRYGLTGTQKEETYMLTQALAQ